MMMNLKSYRWPLVFSLNLLLPIPLEAASRQFLFQNQSYSEEATYLDFYAKTQIAKRYLDPQNPKYSAQEAVALLKQAAAHVSMAQTQLGHLYRTGLGVPQNIARAKAWYEKAAAQFDTEAMVALGELYEGLDGHTQNIQNIATALQWYLKAADRGSLVGEYRMGWLLSQQKQPLYHYPTAFNQLEKAVAQRKPNALMQMGDLYYRGRLGPRDVKKALYFYEQGAERGSPEAAYKLSLLFATGEDMPISPAKAWHWMNQSSACDYGHAYQQLALWAEQGFGRPVSMRQAATFYEKAAEKGIRPAFSKLGDFYLAGKGQLPRTPEKAFEWYNKAAHANDPYAMYVLSILYETGHGVQHDLEQSVYWFRRAEKNPLSSMAAYEVGRKFRDGQGFSKDWELARQWFLRAAQKGSLRAQIELAEFYQRGLGVPINHRQAEAWLEKAARSGHRVAQYLLGMSHLQPGAGAEQTGTRSKHAFDWLLRAARAGVRPAQYEVGLFYLEGHGRTVPVDLQQAYAWLKLALADQTDKTPSIWLDIASQMDTVSRAKAVQLVKEYRQKYGHLRYEDGR